MFHSGSQYLRHAIVECEAPFDDHTISTTHKRGAGYNETTVINWEAHQSELALYNIHAIPINDQQLWYSDFLREILSTAEKVIVHRRQDLFWHTLSVFVGKIYGEQKEHESFHEFIKNYRVDIDSFKNRYAEIVNLTEYFEKLVITTVPTHKIFRTNFMQLHANPESVIGKIACFTGKPLVYIDTPFKKRPYNLMPNFSELCNAMERRGYLEL